MSRIYAQQKRPVAKASEPSYSAPTVHAPSVVSGASNADLDSMMQAKFRQHFLDNQIPHAEAEADRIAASVSGARTPEEVKTQLGEKMGADFSNVTFHTDSAALKQADAMGARAYTTGSDVYFGQGGFDPGVAAHELVHTVQQGMVGSTMGTVSTPTGGVQMMPSLSAWIKNRRVQKSALRRQTYKEEAKVAKEKEQKEKLENDMLLQQRDPAAWADKQNLYKAAAIMQSIHDENPVVRDLEHQQLVEFLAKGNKKIEKTSWINRKFGKFKSIFNKKKISFDQYEKELAQIENMLSNTIASYTGEHDRMLNNVDLRGLDSKKMRDTADHMRTVANDFQGLDLGDVRASKPDKYDMDAIDADVAMDTDQGAKNIRINTDLFAPGSNALSKAYQEKGENYSAAGIDETGQAFTGVHELGHVVNYQLQDRINEAQNREGNNRLTSDKIARGLLADALASEADEDEELESLLCTHTGLQKDAKRSDQSVRQVIADALTPIQNETQTEAPSALMTALSEAGYTSGYGGSHPSEMYAEAFAAHYRNEYEKNSNSPNQDVLQKKLNPLSSRIVNQSKELFHNKDKLKDFGKRYFSA